MASIVDLFVEPGTAAVLTIWRTGVTNASATVDITVDPAMTGLEATAFTDSSGDDQGRVDITVPDDATPGSYTWSAEIDSVVIWTGQVFIEQNARNTSYVAHSPDIRSLTDPPFIIYRPEDIGAPDTSGAATQLIETGGPTTLDISDIADGEYLRRVGTEIVGDTPSGSGDVTAAVAFAIDNRVLRSDGTGKGAQASTVSVTDAGAVTGVTDLTITGDLAMSAGKLVDGRDVSEDWTASAAHFANTSNPHDTTFTLLLDAPTSYTGEGGKVVKVKVDETGLEFVTGGAGVTDFTDLGDVPSSYSGAASKFVAVTAGADGLEFVDAPSGTGDVVGPASATDNAVARYNLTTGKLIQNSLMTVGDTGNVAGIVDLAITGALTGATSVSTTDLTATGTITGISAADVGADATGTASTAVSTHVGLADPHTQYQKESEKGAALGYASLNADAHVVEPALGVTDGTSTFTFGALTDTQVLYLDGTMIKSKAGAGGVSDFTDLGDVPSSYTGEAGKFLAVKSAEDGVEFVANPAATAVTAASTFATDERVLRSDGTGRGSQASTIAVTDTGAVSGITDLTLTGDIIMSASKLVDGRDISADWTTSSAHFANTSNPHSVTAAQAGAIATTAKGAASGVASLDANTRLVEAAQVLRVTGQDLTAGAVSDGQFLVRSGTTYAGQTHDSTGDPHTQYQQESEKGSANGYAGLDASAFVAQAAPIIRATGVSLTVGSVNDGQMLVRSGSTIVGATAATATRQVVVLGSDFSTSGSGASVTGWSGIFTITAGKTYRIEMGGAHQAASNSVSIAQFAIDWSQTPQLVQTFWTPAHTGGSTAYSEVSVNADNTYANSGAVVSGGANTNFWVGMIGVFKAHASTGGTITVNMRSNDGTTQVTLKAGAFILIDQLD